MGGGPRRNHDHSFLLGGTLDNPTGTRDDKRKLRAMVLIPLSKTAPANFIEIESEPVLNAV